MPKFCGLTVVSANVDGGFNNQRQQLRVDCVQDLLDGDLPVFPLEGHPIYFTFFGFSFTGIFQGYTKNVSANGERYSIICSDASEILDAVAVITEGVYSASPVPNLMNPFAWRENTLGFGEAGANLSGMPWANVLAGINYFANSGFISAYGTPPSYRGIEYGIDLTSIPTMPATYRVSSNGGSLLSLIEQVCQDAGVDFYRTLGGNIIKVNTIDRSAQVSLGVVQTVLDSVTYAGKVVSSQIGSESRGETTSVVLNGGFVNGLFTTSTIYTYWGDDLLGNPIVGTVEAHDDLPGEYNETFSLPSFEIADITGENTYESNIIEMRFALAGMTAWQQYISKYKPDILDFINPIFKPGNGNVAVKPELINDDVVNVDKFLTQELHEQSYIIYSFVKKYADEYYGRKFLARVPDVFVKAASPGSTLAAFSHEPAQAGWIDGGPGALGFPLLDQPKFESQDGRVLAFLTIPDYELINPNEIDSSTMSVVGTSLACRCNVAQRLVVLNSNQAYARIELSSAIHARDEFDGGELRKIINGLNNDLDIDKNGAGGTIGILSAVPPVAFPSSATIPLVSNVDRYGPWYASGADGKVRYEEDSSLVPWEYGSLANMELAAESRVLSGISLQTRSEAATVTFAGTPMISIGEALGTGGPNLTGIQINYADSGFLTTYQFQVFNPRLISGFLRQRLEAQREATAITLENRRKFIRDTARAAIGQNALNGIRQGRAFKDLLPPHIKRESPHEVFIAKAFKKIGDPTTYTMAASSTIEEAVILSNADNHDFSNTVIMSYNGLIRPYQISSVEERPVTSLLPNLYLAPALTGENTNTIVSSSVCPFQPPHDVHLMSWGDEYTGMNAIQRQPSEDGIRAIALTGPIAISGVGYSLNGDIVPSSEDRQKGEDFAVGYLDPVYDERRRLWTVHDIFFGITQEEIYGGQFGEVFIGGESDWSEQVKNIWDVKIESGQKVIVGYSANHNHLIIIGVEPSHVEPILDLCFEKDIISGKSVVVGGKITRVTKTRDTVCRDINDCCGPTSPPPPPSEGTIDIEVEVVDAYGPYSEVFAPIQGRTVTCLNATNSPQTTDENGKVLLTGIPKGSPALSNITTAVTVSGSGETVNHYWLSDTYGNSGSGYTANPYTSINNVRIRFAIRDISFPFEPPTSPPPPPSPPAPVANFVGAPVSGPSPLMVVFTDTSTNSPTSWQWDFGDKSSINTTQNPSHTYTVDGTYTVSLLATNSSGSNVETKVNYITVGAPLPEPE